MTADDLTKMLLSNKFKEFVELIRVLKIKISSDSKSSNSKSSNNKFNHDKISHSDKNDENFVTNYYEKTEEVSFKIKKAE